MAQSVRDVGLFVAEAAHRSKGHPLPEIVDLIVEELCNKTIGRRPCAAPHTVESHLRNSEAKLMLRSRL